MTRLEGFCGEYLWELEIASGQTLALAEAFPNEKYAWRPDPQARTVSEVFVHVATGNFMLLDVIGVPAPADLYDQVPARGQERFLGLIRRNDDLMANLREKSTVVALLKRSLQTVQQSFMHAGDVELERRLHFFNEETSVRRAYLRLLAHSHEHMGQMIAYLRFNGIAPPWPDWRPDRPSHAEAHS